jgi:hypothetical protein
VWSRGKGWVRVISKRTLSIIFFVLSPHNTYLIEVCYLNKEHVYICALTVWFISLWLTCLTTLMF